jgi:hypothetical protein
MYKFVTIHDLTLKCMFSYYRALTIHSVVTTLEQDNLGFESWQRQEIFLHSKTSRFALSPPSLPLNGGSVLLLGRVKWLEHEADHLSQSRAVIKNE